MVANLEEISSGGAILLIEERLEPGLAVSLRAKDDLLHGQVECSAFEPELGWFIRLAFREDSRWHSRLFRPDHFVALCASAFSDVTRAA